MWRYKIYLKASHDNKVSVYLKRKKYLKKNHEPKDIVREKFVSTYKNPWIRDVEGKVVQPSFVVKLEDINFNLNLINKKKGLENGQHED